MCIYIYIYIYIYVHMYVSVSSFLFVERTPGQVRYKSRDRLVRRAGEDLRESSGVLHMYKVGLAVGIYSRHIICTCKYGCVYNLGASLGNSRIHSQQRPQMRWMVMSKELLSAGFQSLSGFSCRFCCRNQLSMKALVLAAPHGEPWFIMTGARITLTEP